MSRPGAPEPTGAAPRARLPPRPGLVELAAAILVVAGVIGVITTAGAWLSGSTDPFLWVGIALNAGSVILGLATRVGRLWIVTLNYAAVLAFLDLLGSSASAQALMVGISEILVVVVLILRKPWFDAVAAARARTAEDDPAPRAEVSP